MRAFKLQRLGSRERIVIGLLRGADPAFGAEARVVFDRLRAEAAAAGLSVAAPGSICVTPHELCLLGIIAALQRQQPDLAFDGEPIWRDTALAAARWLSAASLPLHPYATHRLLGLEEECRALSVRPPRVRRRTCDLPTSGPTEGSARARALRYLQERGRASSGELTEIGVSRQAISAMFKQGLLERVRFGVYRVAPELRRE